LKSLLFSWCEEEAALIQQIGQKNLLGIHLCSV